ncbi:DUF2878 domain-containing protein [Polynucleobacter paneuropaeus]|nr:DUF2878 domain-containing protein [Polynucleobacter paneuropaeus]
MAKFWNFVLFQAGWFACVLGAANHQVLWAVLASLTYIAFHIWRSPSPKTEISLLIKALILGVAADTLIMYLGYINFGDAWPAPYLSPLWMWTLWVLVGTTINGSLSWLRDRPTLAAVLGGICGPLSYEAGIRLGAGEWGRLTTLSVETPNITQNNLPDEVCQTRFRQNISKERK